jgi:hypothetical protein
MKRAFLLVATAAVAGTAAVSTAARPLRVVAAASPRLLVVPRSPVVGQRAVIELRGRVRSPVVATIEHSVVPGAYGVRLRRAGARVWRGTFVFGVGGRWTVRAYGQSAVVVARLPAPAAFAPPGEPGCTPPSPANAGSLEIRGTGGLWAFAGVSSPHAAVLDGVLGKQTKIVWRMVGSGDLDLVAIAPDGSRVPPDWLDPHGSSTWTRPGAEWGSGFTFTQTGCWDLHAVRQGASGDVWLVVRS